MNQDFRSQVFHALADPTRRAILSRIAHERIHVADLAQQFPMSRPAISKHLRILKSAGLVLDEAVGKKRIYRANPKPLAAVEGWLRQYRRFWTDNLQNLKRHIESKKD